MGLLTDIGGKIELQDASATGGDLIHVRRMSGEPRLHVSGLGSAYAGKREMHHVWPTGLRAAVPGRDDTGSLNGLGVTVLAFRVAPGGIGGSVSGIGARALALKRAVRMQVDRNDDALLSVQRAGGGFVYAGHGNRRSGHDLDDKGER